MAVDNENTEEERGGYFKSVDCCLWSFGSAHDGESGINPYRSYQAIN
jgi:hypothetical protein